MARIPIDVYGNTGFLGFEESCGPWYSIFRGWTGILVEPISTVCHCGGLRKCVFIVWSSNMARTLNCLHVETIFSRCWGVFWFVIEHLSQVKLCSGLVSQHCVLLQLDQKVCIHGLIHYKWPEHWLSFMAKPVFQVLRSLLILGRASSACEKVFSFSHQHCVPLQLDQKVCIHGLIQCKWLEHWLALMAKSVFQVLRSLLDRSRSAFMGENVFRWSQSALHHHVPLHWAQKSFYSRFDPSTNSKYIWTGIYGRTVLPGFEESNQMVMWPMTSRDPETTNSWPQYALSTLSRKQLKMLFSINH